MGQDMSDTEHGGVESTGGKGESLIDPHHTRASLNVIRKAVEKGWNIPQEWMDELPAIASRIAREGRTERDRLRALEVLKAMAAARVDAAIALDKIERLDGGNPTDIITTFEVKLPGADD